MLGDALFDITGHSDIQDVSLTGEDVDVVELRHIGGGCRFVLLMSVTDVTYSRRGF